MWILKTYNQVPPGGFPYEQTDGLSHRFRSVPIIHEQAKQVGAFRQGNRLPRADLASCLEDVDRQICASLPDHLRVIYCHQTENSFTQTHANDPLVKGPCGTCGAIIE